MPAWSPPMPPAAPPPAPTPNIQLPSVCSDRPLSSLSVEDVCQLVSDLAGISAEAAARYHRTLRSNNISGWVLCACEMPALKRTMKMTFGDWETFRAAVETLRKREAAGPTVPCSSAAEPAAATFTASAAPVTAAAPTSAASDAAEARKIRFQLTTDSGKVTQANSATSSTVTSPLVSDGRQPPPSSQSSGSVRRRSGPDNHLEKQTDERRGSASSQLTERRVSFEIDQRRGSLELARLSVPRAGPLERRGSLPPSSRRSSAFRSERRGSADSLPSPSCDRFDSAALGDLVHASYAEEFDFSHYLEEEALLEERSRRGLYPILEGGRPADVTVNMEDTAEALELELKKGAPVALVVDDGEHVTRESVETPTMDSCRELIEEDESADEQYAYDNEGYDRL
ncbi:Kinase D-interacting substrate B [Amphibalanus amphitrite]|uniref:Kinase D-interacting substrate B n=1 Tax=Amphibalanus amphitrite TaxID=1232801 RepID=A0A6A4XCE3_AMPAM|nr:Kinase D-interacting substrate B [Amphibalanus amphitrite]